MKSDVRKHCDVGDGWTVAHQPFGSMNFLFDDPVVNDRDDVQQTILGRRIAKQIASPRGGDSTQRPTSHLKPCLDVCAFFHASGRPGRGGVATFCNVQERRLGVPDRQVSILEHGKPPKRAQRSKGRLSDRHARDTCPRAAFRSPCRANRTSGVACSSRTTGRGRIGSSRGDLRESFAGAPDHTMVLEPSAIGN